VPPQGCGALLGAEREISEGVREAREAQHLVEVVARVRRRDEAPARAQHTRQLAEGAVEIGHVVEHPRGDRNVERPVLEGQLPNVPDLRVDAACTRELDHALRLVDGDDLDPELVLHSLGQLALPAADLEH
jgi:hypothetical protein